MVIITPAHEITKALKILLETQMKTQEVVISSAPLDLVPNQSIKRVNLYLFKVEENTSLRNQTIPTSSQMVTQPPLPLNLNYLLTPFPDTNNYDEDYDLIVHEMLTDAMGVFYNYPVLTGSSEIPGSGIKLFSAELQEQIELIKIIPSSLDTIRLMEIWKGIKMPYRLSVAYTVTATFKTI